MPYPFSVGQIYTASDANAVGLIRIESCTVSSVGGTSATASDGIITIGNGNTSVTVSNAFSANFHSYLIRITNGSGSVLANVGMTLGASATGYYSAGVVYTAAGAGTVIPDNNAASWTRVGQMAANSFHMDLTLHNPFLAKHTQANWWYNIWDATANNFGMATGTHAVATSYSAFTITPGAGSFSSGSLSIYGYTRG